MITRQSLLEGLKKIAQALGEYEVSPYANVNRHLLPATSDIKRMTTVPKLGPSVGMQAYQQWAVRQPTHITPRPTTGPRGFAPGTRVAEGVVARPTMARAGAVAGEVGGKATGLWSMLVRR